MATSAMNGAIYDSTFNVFFKLNYAKTYDAILSTPVGVGDVALGEIAGRSSAARSTPSASSWSCSSWAWSPRPGPS
jgi:hypothetical protein